MANPNAAKGAKFELAIVAFLKLVFGRLVRRPHQEGFIDVGDIHLPPFVLQAKDWADVTSALRVGLAGAQAQAKAAGEPYGVVVLKSRRSNISEARVAMTLTTFRDVVARLLNAERLLARHAPEVFHTEHLPTFEE